MTSSLGIAALAWVLLAATALTVANARPHTAPWRSQYSYDDEIKRPRPAFQLNGSGRSLKDANASSASTTCTYLPDTESYCIGANGLCNSDDRVGRQFRRACQTTCKICTSASAETELRLEQGQVVELKTGFVLLEGSQTEQGLHDGFQMWLSFSGAGGFGVPVGNGFVKISHSTEYAVKDDGCESYHAAARRLIEQQITFAIIQSHTCKVNLSATFHDAGVLHFVQTGTDMTDYLGEEYRNKHSWYLYLSSNDYPRLFLKHLSYIKASKIAVVFKNDDPWTRSSASWLHNAIASRQDSDENDPRIVQTFTYSGNFASSANEDPSMWRYRLQAMANAPTHLRPDALIVYSRAEGEMIMRQATDIKMPLRGVYITGASSWMDPDTKFAEYVVTPGQWAADVQSRCSVFRSNNNYVKLFIATYGYEPDYKIAMSSAAGVVFQLALQQAGTTRVSKIMEALSLLSAETIAGRVRFSYQQRNIGRDPILMQYQAYDQDVVAEAPPKLLTVLPMDLATGELKDFIQIRCRIFLQDDNPDVCSDEERAVFEQCFEAHPEKIQPYSQACLNRTTAEEIAKAQGQGLGQSQSQGQQNNLAVIIPWIVAAVVFVLIGIAFLYVTHSRWKNSASYFRMMMRKNPPGTMGTGRPVTLVVTDIEDSTAMWEACADDMNGSLAMHNHCLRDALKECCGYEVCNEGDSFTVAFHEVNDALKWCCVVQERLQSMMWPENIIRYGERKDKERLQYKTRSKLDSLSDFLTKNGTRKRKSAHGLGGLHLERAASSSILRGPVIPEFFGIRVRMGVHTSPVDEVSRHPVTNRVIFPNEFVHKATTLSETACGGQVIMSSQTLAEADSCATGNWWVMHMGAHILEKPLTEEEKAVTRSMQEMSLQIREGQATKTPDDSEDTERISEELFMLVPNSIANRALYYPPIKSVKQVAGGYLQAPSSTEGDIVIAFAQVHSLASMMMMFEKDMVEHCMRLLRDCVSKVLGETNGYECEENGGIFVFAFPSADCAIRWATEVQESLLTVDWPPELLRHPACETWIMAGQTMFRGPRLKVGMAQGPVLSKHPSSVTGRAVYRGPIMNRAARVKSTAAAGQVVVSSKTWDACTNREDFVELDLGEFTLKGVEEAITLFQISRKGSYLQYRSFVVEEKKVSQDLADSEMDSMAVFQLESLTRMPTLESSNLWRSLTNPPQLSYQHLSFNQSPTDVLESMENPGSHRTSSTRSISPQGVALKLQNGKKKLSSVTYANPSDFADIGPPHGRFGTALGLEVDFDLPRPSDA